VHPDRPSIGRCEGCGRTSCLGCAVPFRGRVLCRTCAATALGTPEPLEIAPVPPSRAGWLLAGGVLTVGLAATIPPWHRSGTLTGPFSTWTPAAEGPVFLAVLALGAGVLTAGGALVLNRGGRAMAVAVVALAVVAGVAIAFSLARAPDFYAFTPAPFVALGAAAGGAVAGLLRLRPATGRPPR
jgi:hypothetical protein